MKKTFLIIPLALTLFIGMPASFAAGKKDIPPAKSALNIMDLTNSQTYRYGREMYLSRRYTEAVKVFAEVLRRDCHNKLAHYHLQKIADEVPAFAYLKEELKDFPCATPDFSKEDFLPAPLFYEKDTEILLEQMLSYKKRERLSEAELDAALKRYTAIVNELETKLAAAKVVMPPSGDLALNKAAISELENGQATASKIEKTIALLTNKLASERLERQKEVQDMRTRVAEAEASLAATTQSAATAVPSADDPDAYSPSAIKLKAAVEKAKEQLAGQEQSLSEKDRSLATLQERFDNIQQRLRLIQTDLANKNVQIEKIHTNIQDQKL